MTKEVEDIIMKAKEKVEEMYFRRKPMMNVGLKKEHQMRLIKDSLLT